MSSLDAELARFEAELAGRPVQLPGPPVCQKDAPKVQSVLDESWYQNMTSVCYGHIHLEGLLQLAKHPKLDAGTFGSSITPSTAARAQCRPFRRYMFDSSSVLCLS